MLKNNSFKAKPLVSVIIPIFNVENYLPQAIESVLAQTYQEIEVICIDDGSSDNSGRVAEKYTHIDGRVSYHHQKNQGLGAARNAGLSLARGEYISFLDPDDWLEDHALQTMIDEILSKKVEMVMCEMKVYDESRNIFYDDQSYLFNYLPSTCDKGFAPIHELDNLFKISVSACNKLFNRSLIEKLKLRFPEKIIFEDNPFFYEYYLSVKRVGIVREKLYLRRIRTGSITMTNQGEKYADIFSIFQQLELIFKKNTSWSEISSMFFQHQVGVSLGWLRKSNQISKPFFYKKMHDYFKDLTVSDYDLKLLLRTKEYALFKLIVKTDNFHSFQKKRFFLPEVIKYQIAHIPHFLSAKSKRAQPKLSLIIPLYNAAQTLPRCLDSILIPKKNNQKSHDLEIILINDGSTDESFKILEKYQSDYADRAKIIILNQTKQNAGVARNRGIDRAHGRYLFFVDADDQLFSQKLQTIMFYISLRKPEILLCPAIGTDKLRQTTTKLSFPYPLWARPRQISFRQGAKFLCNGLIAPWAKIYKAEFLKKNHLIFQSITSANDVAFHFQTLMNAKKILYSPEYCYEYSLTRVGSISSQINKNYRNIFLSRKEVVDRAQKFLPEEFRYAKIFLVKRFVSDFLYFLPLILEPETKVLYMKELQNFSIIMQNLFDKNELMELNKAEWWKNFLSQLD